MTQKCTMAQYYCTFHSIYLSVSDINHAIKTARISVNNVVPITSRASRFTVLLPQQNCERMQKDGPKMAASYP